MDFIRFQDSDTLSRSGLILEPDTSILEHKTAILQSTQTIGFKYRFEFSIPYSRFLRIKNIESIDYVFLILDSYQNSFFFIRELYTFYHDLHILSIFSPVFCPSLFFLGRESSDQTSRSFLDGQNNTNRPISS